MSPLLILFVLSGSWLFRGDRSALAFTEAEVAMLFTAPVTRRGLIVYKLVRSQVTILFSVLIWSLLLRRGSTALPVPFSAVAFWSLFTTLSLHRLGAALVRAATVEHGAAGARRNWVPIAAALAFVVIVMAQMGDTNADLSGGSGPLGLMNRLTAFLASAPVRTALFPVRLVLAPAFSQSVTAWGQAMLPALAVLVVHVIWVLRSDTAFEEAAAVASAERARQIESIRQRRGGGGIPAPRANARLRTIALAPVGSPAMAIFWKNIIGLTRGTSYALILGPLVIAFALAITLSKGRGDVTQTIAFVCLVVTGVLMLIGGRALRNDLRSDMLHLPMLKSLPLGGGQLVLAEVASGTFPLAALQLLLLGVAFGANALTVKPILAGDVRLALLFVAPVVLLAFNAASFTILNGTAVLFPAWIRLGPSGPGGIEAMGQQILTTFGTWVVLALMLILPAVTCRGIMVIGGDGDAVAIAIGLVTGSLVLGVETYGVVRWLGGVYERAEPSQVAQ